LSRLILTKIQAEEKLAPWNGVRISLARQKFVHVRLRVIKLAIREVCESHIVAPYAWLKRSAYAHDLELNVVVDRSAI